MGRIFGSLHPEVILIAAIVLVSYINAAMQLWKG